MKIEFLVSITDESLYEANALHLNGVTIAKFIREELQGCGGHFARANWRRSLLKKCTVKPVRRKK